MNTIIFASENTNKTGALCETHVYGLSWLTTVFYQSQITRHKNSCLFLFRFDNEGKTLKACNETTARGWQIDYFEEWDFQQEAAAPESWKVLKQTGMDF